MLPSDGPSSKEAEAGAEAGAKEERCFPRLSYRTQDLLPRDGTTHNRLGLLSQLLMDNVSHWLAQNVSFLLPFSLKL